MTYDLRTFTLRDRLSCGVGLMRVTNGAHTMVEAASAAASYLVREARPLDDGRPALAAVLFYKTGMHEALSDELRALWAFDNDGQERPGDGARFSTLLASAGEPDAVAALRALPGGDLAPLASSRFVAEQPLLAHLYHQLGLDLRTIASFSPEVEQTPEGKTYAVLLVEDAAASPYAEAGRELVESLGIRSILAFGGRLVQGDVIGIVLHSRVPITAASAEHFRTVALDVTALFRSHEGRVFA